jgi:hypothetical protein
MEGDHWEIDRYLFKNGKQINARNIFSGKPGTRTGSEYEQCFLFGKVLKCSHNFLPDVPGISGVRVGN